MACAREAIAVGKRILIVDDTAELLRLMRLLLEEDQYQVSVLESGRDAVATAKEQRPDFIVLDLLLNGEPAGLDVLQALRSDPETAAIPVIVYTAAMLLAEEAQRLLASDPDRYAGTHVLRKPFALDELVHIIA
jgi:CheY-like chemotaxis protein